MYRTRQQKRGSVYDRSDRYNGIKTIHDAAVPRKDEAEILDALFSLDIRGDQISQLRHDGDDDGKIDGGAPFTGAWVMTHIEITDEEGTDGGDTAGLGTVRLTLNDDNTFVYEVNIPGDGEEEPESYTERGTWAWANPLLTLNYGDYRSQLKVLTWTDNKLVTEQSEDGETERRTWKKQ